MSKINIKNFTNKIIVLSGLFLFLSQSAIAGDYKLLPCGWGFYLYVNYDGREEPYWHALKTNKLEPRSLLRQFPSLSLPELTTAIDLIKNQAPDTAVKISILEDAIKEKTGKVFFDLVGNYFQILEGYSKPCVDLTVFNETCQDELQQIIQDNLQENRNFEKFLFYDDEIFIEISNREIKEGNCFVFTVARILGYSGNDILKFLTEIDTAAIHVLGLNITHYTLVENSRAIFLDEIQVGDWVFYPGNPESYDSEHWGVVINRDKDENIWVESKWGIGASNLVRKHKVEEIPITYGRYANFYRLNPEFKAKIESIVLK